MQIKFTSEMHLQILRKSIFYLKRKEILKTFNYTFKSGVTWSFKEECKNWMYVLWVSRIRLTDINTTCDKLCWLWAWLIPIKLPVNRKISNALRNRAIRVKFGARTRNADNIKLFKRDIRCLIWHLCRPATPARNHWWNYPVAKIWWWLAF